MGNQVFTWYEHKKDQKHSTLCAFHDDIYWTAVTIAPLLLASSLLAILACINNGISSRSYSFIVCSVHWILFHTFEIYREVYPHSWHKRETIQTFNSMNVHVLNFPVIMGMWQWNMSAEWCRRQPKFQKYRTLWTLHCTWHTLSLTCNKLFREWSTIQGVGLAMPTRCEG